MNVSKSQREQGAADDLSAKPQSSPEADQFAAPADEDQIERQVVDEKLDDAGTPGYAVEFSPLEADRAGAFDEDALSEGDALASGVDLASADMPTFVEGNAAGYDLPDHVTFNTARDLFGAQPGESIAEAAARKAGK